MDLVSRNAKMYHSVAHGNARYVDISARPMGSTESLFDYVLQTQNPALHPDRLHRCARLWGRCYWGKQYPDNEVTDDMENYRALELLHEGMMLRHKLWKILSDDPNPSEDVARSHFVEMMAVQDVRSLTLPAPLHGDLLTKHRDIPIFLLLPSWPRQHQRGVPWSRSTWPLLRSTRRSYSTADFCARLDHPQHSNDRPSEIQPRYSASSTRQIRNYFAGCIGHCSQ